MSVGFDPIGVEPNGKGGYNFNKWELLELSIVSVPANPGATVFACAFGKDGRVLAAAHADTLMRAHRRIGAARQDLADVLLVRAVRRRRMTATPRMRIRSCRSPRARSARGRTRSRQSTASLSLRRPLTRQIEASKATVC